MIPDTDGKPESKKIDSDAMMRQLDIELAQKRAEWAQSGARRRTLRTLSLLFLALVVIAALYGFFFLFTNPPQPRSKQSAPATDTPSPGP
ncbi:MAG TPA: hypothetical protein VGG94_02175 [Chthoniobacterales bacterium]|jgi:hypothetical protein